MRSKNQHNRKVRNGITFKTVRLVQKPILAGAGFYRKCSSVRVFEAEAIWATPVPLLPPGVEASAGLSGVCTG